MAMPVFSRRGTAARHHPPALHWTAALGLALCSPAVLSQAASPPPAAPERLPAITVTGTATPTQASVTGFGERPLIATPIQATVIEREELEASGARRLSDLTRFDASATDAYNSAGYWDQLTLRGYVIDQRFNFRREGLPISGETPIPLENKERVEILKGTSGIQAGTSAPGGLVQYIVKRPTPQPLRTVTLHTGERGTLGAALDISHRMGGQGAHGYRLNAALEHRDPVIRDYPHQQRSLLALATDFRIDADTLLDAEFEWSRQRSPSVPAYSLLGSRVPAPIAPANLNNQPWSQPNVFDALTGSVRLDRALGGGWRWVTQAGAQNLKTDDRLAYPFGCSAEGVFDRYCSDGTFDIYDYRSDGERRRVLAAQTAFIGAFQTGALAHELTFGVLASRLRYTQPFQANNYVGIGHVDGSLVTPEDPALTDDGTNRRERSVEWFVHDAIDWGGGWTTWLGLRHTRLQRDSVRTSGARATSYQQSLTTPWLAASYEWQPRQMVYASWGQGAESAVVPGRPDRYPNAGQALPALKSRQWEIGLKGQAGPASWTVAYFDIQQPAITDTGTAFFQDGRNRHTGIDGAVGWRSGPWFIQASAMLLDARREGAADTGLNGQRPVNVPRHTLRLNAAHELAGVPGLTLWGGLSHEGSRDVLPGGEATIPSWTRVDVGATYVQRTAATTLTWRLGIDNLLNRRAWKESPFQYGHAYLFPLEARALRLSVQAAF